MKAILRTNFISPSKPEIEVSEVNKSFVVVTGVDGIKFIKHAKTNMRPDATAEVIIEKENGYDSYVLDLSKSSTDMTSFYYVEVLELKTNIQGPI